MGSTPTVGTKFMEESKQFNEYKDFVQALHENRDYMHMHPGEAYIKYRDITDEKLVALLQQAHTLEIVSRIVANKIILN